MTSGIVDIYKQTCRELFEYTRKVEYLRRNPPPPHPLQKAWNKLFGIKYEQRGIAPRDQDLENIKYGHECTDPVLLQHLKPLTFEFIQLLKTIVKRHQPVKYYNR